MRKELRMVGLAAATVAAMASPALAQGFGWGGMMGGGCPTIGMMGPGMMMGGFGGGWGGGPGMMQGQQPRLDAVIGGRLAYLKAELGITEAQTEAWDAYAEALDTRLEGMQATHTAMWDSVQQGTAVDRMNTRIAAMEGMLEAMKAMQPATEALYAVLDDTQKQKADDLIGLGCGAM